MQLVNFVGLHTCDTFSFLSYLEGQEYNSMAGAYVGRRAGGSTSGHVQVVALNRNSSRRNNHALQKHSPGVASSSCVLVDAASMAEAIRFELLRCREERAARLQDPMLLEASLSPPSFSWAAHQPDPGLRAEPTVSVPPAEGAPVGPPMLEPRPVYDLEVETTVAMNPTLEDIAQPCADLPDLQTEITSCSEEPRTPIASSYIVAEDTASHECRLKTFVEELSRPIPSPLVPRPVKTKRAPIPPLQGQLGLPKRSKCLANHPLASVASSKHAEVMLMRHFSVIPEVAAPNSDSKKAYTQLYKEKLDAGHFEAIRDLLSALHSSSVMGFTAE